MSVDKQFDPEKVERSYPDTNGNMEPCDTASTNYVSGADYDKLLALYRTLHGQWRELRDGIDHLHFQLHAQEAPPDTDLPTIEEMCGFLDHPSEAEGS